MCPKLCPPSSTSPRAQAARLVGCTLALGWPGIGVESEPGVRYELVWIQRLPGVDQRKRPGPHVICQELQYRYAIWKPSMANFGLDSNGVRRCWFWNLVAPSGIYHSRLFLDSRICLAFTAIRSVVYGPGQGSVRCDASLDFERATPAPVGDMSAWCCRLRSRSLFVADVARAVASRFVFVLFGLLVLAPVTIKEVHSRRKALPRPMKASDC
jgi:hypothetical protein